MTTFKLILFLVIFLPIQFITAQNLSSKRYVGEKYGGGIIFHLWEDSLHVQHGLIISPTPIIMDDNGFQWSNVTKKRVADKMCKDGKINSKLIINQKGHFESAAQLCDNFKLNGYNDWYLPSLEECRLLFNVKDIINYSLYDLQLNDDQTYLFLNSTTCYNFTQGKNYGDYFWTSTEYNEDKAIRVNLIKGSIDATGKDYKNTGIRPIRAF